MKYRLLQFWKPLLAVTFWGASFVATKVALEELNPQTIILLRIVLGCILLFIIAISTKRDFKITLKNHGWIFLLASIAVFHLWIQITGLKYTTATNTGWIIGVTPVFIAVLGFLVFKEKLSPVRIMGIAIAFAGLVLLISKGNIFRIGFLTHKGDFLVLASTVTWSVYSIVTKKIALSYPPLMTIFFLFLMMAIIISPFAITGTVLNTILHLPVRIWLAVLFLGIFCSGVAYVLWAQALKELEAAKVGAFLYIEPFVTVFAAWIVLAEVISVITIISGIIITAGVILVNRK